MKKLNKNLRSTKTDLDNSDKQSDTARVKETDTETNKMTDKDKLVVDMMAGIL
ncbi:MAG: hypothetical protein AAGF54_01925 [Pseudomonadota bacterium]